MNRPVNRLRGVAVGAVVALVGFGLAVLSAIAADIPMAGDGAELLMIGFGAALLPGLGGALVLRLLRFRSVQVQAVVVALVAVAGVAAGVVAASTSMFLSEHDRNVVLTVVVASGTVGVLAALALGGRVGRATRNLTELTRRIGAGEAGGAVPLSAPEEFSRLAGELNAMEARLAAAEASRRELVTWVSHDLRTPLAGIRALVEALEDGVADDPATVSRYHATLREQTDRLARLVDDLFELSRLQAGTLIVQRASVRVDDLVSDALAAAGALAQQRGIHLSGEVESPPSTLWVATRELGRALQNLLDNALRHTPSGGTVRVAAGLGEGGVTITVTDTGGGIPDAELASIFEPGFTGDRARSPRDGGGSGLGLAIARGFVELHGGRLAAGNVDGGARFTMWLPCLDDGSETASPGGPATSGSVSPSPARGGQRV